MPEPRRVRLTAPGGEWLAAVDADFVNILSPVRRDVIASVPHGWVEDVEPPLPPEPQAYGFYRGRDGRVWQHHSHGWVRLTGSESSVAWAVAHHHGPFTPLVAINPDDKEEINRLARAIHPERMGLSHSGACVAIAAVFRALVEGAQQ